MFENLTIRWRMLLLVAAFFVGLAVQATMLFRTFDKVRIGGAPYQRISANKDVIADLAPPPSHLLEAYLVVHQALDESDAKQRAQDLARVRSLHEVLAAHYRQYRENLPAGATRR